MKRGDKVICISETKNSTIKKDIFPHWLKKGKVYTLREVKINNGKNTTVLLDEVINPNIYCPELLTEFEPGFISKRFMLLSDFIFSKPF